MRLTSAELLHHPWLCDRPVAAAENPLPACEIEGLRQVCSRRQLCIWCMQGCVLRKAWLQQSSFQQAGCSCGLEGLTCGIPRMHADA